MKCLVKKIVVTGASGFVGRQLVPLLKAKGYHLLLIGRDPVSLGRQFPGYQVDDYESITALRGYDAIVHLSVLNSDSRSDEIDFRKVNVDLAVRVFDSAHRAGIKHFVFASSVHALNFQASHPYAVSKREASIELRKRIGPILTTIYLPTLYGEEFSGKLNFLNACPHWLRKAFLPILRAVKPIGSIQALADQLALVFEGQAGSSIMGDATKYIGLYQAIARFFDIVLSFVLLVLALPAMVVIAIAIRLSSSGPIIFRQDRVGRDGNIFKCLKFRTMQQGTANVPTHEARSSDVTRVGAWLRRTKLDELPQCLNVIAGEMSFVGPRPCLPNQTELVALRLQGGVLRIRPGITGLAQLHGIDMSDPKKLTDVDRQYVAMRCLSLDARIIRLTLWGKGVGDGIRFDR